MPRIRTVALSLTLALATISALFGMTPANAAVALPGNRANYVVSLGKFTAKSSWVRLAQYSFSTSGTVTETFWYWTQAGPFMVDPPKSTVTIAGCSGCTVKTPLNFNQNSNYPRTLSGVYEVASGGGSVAITWSSGATEQWTVSNAATATRIRLDGSSYGATNGWGWGSNASLATAASTASIKAGDRTFRGQYVEDNWGTEILSGTTQLGMNVFSTCGASCLHARTGSGETRTRSYIGHLNDATYPRKDAYQFARDTVNGPDQEITRGHVQGFLQIIDDDNRFVGWVGAQASIYSTTVGSDIVAIYELTDVS